MNEELPSVEIMRLQPGDVIVACLPVKADKETAQTLAEGLRQFFPGHEVIVCGGGIEISVVRPEVSA